jgi:hypothetical protein
LRLLHHKIAAPAVVAKRGRVVSEHEVPAPAPMAPHRARPPAAAPGSCLVGNAAAPGGARRSASGVWPTNVIRPSTTTTGALPGVHPAAAAGGVDVWASALYPIVRTAAVHTAAALDFSRGRYPGSQVDPSCMACTTFVGGPFAVQLRSNCGPTSPNFAGQRAVWSFRDSRNRANFAPPHPNRRSNQAQTRPKHAQTLMQFEESGQTLLSVRPPSCV